MKRTSSPHSLFHRFASALTSFTLGIAALVFASGCETSSPTDTNRTVDANVAGVYRNTEGRFVSQNSGNEVTQLNVRQTGDQLEAIDNNGIVFRGTIGTVLDNNASFTLNGSTTVGNSVIISGNIAIGGGVGVMSGTWIEDSLFATVSGSAVGPSVTSNAPPPATNVVRALSIASSGGFNLNSNGQQVTLTASGGTPPYTWSVADQSRGQLSDTNVNSVVYRRVSVGSNTVTLRDSTGTNTASQNMSQP